MTRTRTSKNVPPVENRLHKSIRAKAITLMAVAGAMAVSCPQTAFRGWMRRMGPMGLVPRY